MSIDKDVRIAQLEAELEMERAKNSPQIIHAQPTTPESVGEIVDRVRRWRK